MKCPRTILILAASFATAGGLYPMTADAQKANPESSCDLPSRDRRAQPPRDLNTPRQFDPSPTLAAWEARRAAMRTKILVSMGLYPLPARTPLRAHVSGRVERDGYSIEKVYFQTYPGFYLAGNLYRPLPRKTGRTAPHGPYPGILVAHGHWAEGRMANNNLGSIPARAITFARQGAVAFTYDMVGYNDTRQVDHRFAGDRKHWLWGISLMGLQTWNSIRALDFLCSLPDVDQKRLAITGESGGGTQTMILGAVDDRLAAVAPCVMVSHTMQGGCLCENAPGLRVDFSNMDIAAMAAPRPQIMVSATGDWTKTMMTVEGPAVASVYSLYGAPDRVSYVIYDFPHNINSTSRQAVYDFFGRWLLHQPDSTKLKEAPYEMEPVASLRVFPDGTPLPRGARDAASLTGYLVDQARTQLEKAMPRSRASLKRFKATYQPAWRDTLGVSVPEARDLLSVSQPPVAIASGVLTRLNVGRVGACDNIPAAFYSPAGKQQFPAVVLADPGGRAALMDQASGQPGPVVAALLAHGCGVLLLDAFLTGERTDATLQAARKPFSNFFTTYNRTDLQERVQDLVTGCAYLRARGDVTRIVLAGQGRAGLWALLAAPAADAVAADCDQLDLSTDTALLADDLFVPCLRRLGDFSTAALLAAPHPLLLHNTGELFDAAALISEAYHTLDYGSVLKVERARLANETLVHWITGALRSMP